MTSLRLIALSGVALLSSAAMAEDLKISAGEHGAYSRLVFPGAVADVRVDGEARSVEVQLPTNGTIVDLSDITGKHKAYRVLDAALINAGEATIVRFSLKCDCSVETVTLPSGRTVIDIADAKTAAAPSAETPVAASPSPPAATQIAAETPPAAPESELSVEEARARMRDLFQRAADEGFVTMRGAEPAVAEAPAPAQAAAQSPKEIAVKTDKTKLPPAPPAPPAEEPKITRPCEPDDAFAIEGGRFDSDPLAAIGEFRAVMEEAPENERRAAVDAFARGYLAIGFGEEALALLTDIGQGDSLLADMARVVAEAPLSDRGPLMGAAECVGAHALWQAAAAAPEAAATAARHSGDAIDALPKRLRTLLAARIAKKLIDAEAWRSAERFHGVASKFPEYADSDLKYIEARLLEHEGGAVESETMLREVASGDSQASHDALIALAERYAAEGASPGEEFVEDLGALAMRAKGLPEGAEAALHEAMIWTGAGNVEAGVFLLQSAVESDPSLAERASLEAARSVAAAFDSDDAEKRLAALRTLLTYRPLVERAGPTPGTRIKAANAAIEAGLPNLALQLLDGVEDGDGRATVLLRARAALAAGAGETALASAAPYADDAEFARIVVDANLQLGQNYAALAAASALPENIDKSRAMALAAWRAGDYASAARAYRKIDPNSLGAEDAVRFALSAYMAGEAELPAAAQAVLQRDDSAMLVGVKSLFERRADGSLVERGSALAKSAGDEIELVREILGNG